MTQHDTVNRSARPAGAGETGDPGRSRWFGVLTALGGLAAATLTNVCHRRWMSAPEGTTRRGLFDVLCHAGTALSVALPALPYVRDRAGFLAVALICALVIDLDHILAARSVRPREYMTMPQRPASHSLLALLLVALAVERCWPARHIGLGALLGLASHLLRDLGTGGAPLFHPRRVITMPYGVVMVLLGALAVISRQACRLRGRLHRRGGERDPAAVRRPVALAPVAEPGARRRHAPLRPSGTL